MSNLRAQVIKLAYAKPELRSVLLPLIKQASHVGDIILQQMGGIRTIAMFTGARDFVRIPNGIQIKFPNNVAGKPNFVKITLNGADLYDVEFLRLRASNFKIISNHRDIYADMLVDLFERETGLYLSF